MTPDGLAAGPLPKFVGFLGIGALAACLYALISTLLTDWSPGYGPPISIAVYACFIPIVFVAQRRLTFRSSGQPTREFVKYVALQVVSVIASTLILTPLLSDNPLLNMLTFLAVASLCALISFSICDTWIFGGGGPKDLSIR